MKYFLIAGEASGDLHAAQLIGELKSQDALAEFSFFGGDMMAKAAGVAPLIHYKDMAFMGFIEVLKHLSQILGFLKRAKCHVDDWRPDAVILVDYPSFNLKVAKYAYEKGIPAFYFISPKVWAWKEYRVKQIKKYITELYSILPFETEFYARHGYAVEYVGNPTVKEILTASSQFADSSSFKVANGLETGKEIIAIVPGSRHKEIRDNLPEMVAACSKYGQYQAVIAGAPNIEETEYRKILDNCGDYGRGLKIMFGKSWELVAHSRAAVVTSGTATLETAILGTPQVVCYRMNGSKRVYNWYKRLLKVKYVSLPNLIADAPVVVELLLHYCNRESIGNELGLLLGDTPRRKAVLDGYAKMRDRLGTNDCAATAAYKLVEKLESSANK